MSNIAKIELENIYYYAIWLYWFMPSPGETTLRSCCVMNFSTSLNNDVTWAWRRLKSWTVRLFVQQLLRTNNNENTLNHALLTLREYTPEIGGFPWQWTSNVENVSVPWRHHDFARSIFIHSTHSIHQYISTWIDRIFSCVVWYVFFHLCCMLNPQFTRARPETLNMEIYDSLSLKTSNLNSCTP